VVDLKSLLIQCADAWCAVHENAPLSRLGKRVAGDAGFFERIGSRNGGCNLATLERFARYFELEESWPQGEIPDLARDFVGRVCGAIAA
jgi:hypothetical protein